MLPGASVGAMDARKGGARRLRSLYWTAMTEPERKLRTERVNGVDFGDELGLLRMRILRLATAVELDGDKQLERTRLMLSMLEVLARLGNLQARIARVEDDGAGELNALLWEEGGIQNSELKIQRAAGGGEAPRGGNDEPG